MSEDKIPKSCVLHNSSKKGFSESIRLELFNGIVNSDKKFELMIITETPNERRVFSFPKNEMKVSCTLNSDVAKENKNFTLIFQLKVSKTFGMFNKTFKVKFNCVAPEIGWYHVINDESYNIMDNDVLLLQIVKLEILFKPTIPKIIQSTLESKLTVRKNCSLIEMFDFIQCVNRHRIQNAKQKQKNYVDILEYVTTVSNYTVAGNVNLSGSKTDFFWHGKGNIQCKTIGQHSHYYIVRRKLLSMYDL